MTLSSKVKGLSAHSGPHTADNASGSSALSVPDLGEWGGCRRMNSTMDYGQAFFLLRTVAVPFHLGRWLKAGERAALLVAFACLPYAVLVTCAGWMLFDFVLFEKLLGTGVICYAGAFATVMTFRLGGNGFEDDA